MKRFFFSFCIILISAVASAQVGAIEKEASEARNMGDRFTKVEPGNSWQTGALQSLRDEAFWFDDFSDPSTWIREDESTPFPLGWEIITNANAAPVGAFQPLNFSSIENGFAMINGDSASAGDASQQNATIRSLTSVDLSAEDGVSIVFEQATRNWATTYYLQWSYDGDEWNEFPINLDVATNTNTGNPDVFLLDMTPQLANQPEVYIGFRFEANWGWFWAIDDVALIETPENDLSVNNAYYSNWRTLVNQDVSPVEVLVPDNVYVHAFEYSQYARNQVRPLSPTVRVENRGFAPQTGVTFTATITDPDGMSEEFSTSMGEIAPGEMVFMTIEDVMPDAFSADQGMAKLGTYTVEYMVEQDQEDEFPGNNAGDAQSFEVTEDLMANDNNAGVSWLLVDGNNTSNFTRYVFEEEAQVDYITFALTTGNELQENAVFESVFVNIIQGSFLDEPGPTNMMDTLLTQSLEYFIQDVDVLSGGENGLQFITVMLEEPLVLQANTIYQPVVTIPSSNEDFLWTVVHGSQENYASLGAENADGDASLFSMGNLVFCVRMGSSQVMSTNGAQDLTFMMSQNYPNPFNGSETRIDWELMAPAKNAHFTVFDLNGRMVHQQNFGSRPAGKQEPIILNTNLPAGVYQYSLTVDNHRIARKMIVAK